jgi:hypothetical protein
MQGFGFKVWVQRLRSTILRQGCRVLGLGFRVNDLGCIFRV